MPHQRAPTRTHHPPKRHQPSTRNSPNEAVGAAPACPPERPRSGVSIPKIHALCVGNLTMDAPLWGDTGGHIGTAPTHLHQTMRGVPLPSSGYTFDSVGLASATQPTLGNGGQQGGYPQRGLYFLSPTRGNDVSHIIYPNETHKQSPHTTIGGGNASRTPAPSTLNEWNFMILASP